MARKGRKQNKQDAAKADEPVVDSANDVEENEAPPADENNETESPKRGAKRGSSSKDDTTSKKKKGKAEENGVASSRPRRATASKAAEEVKSLLAPKKKTVKKTAKRSPSPKKEPSQFEVESIIDSRKRKGRTEFKIRWKGYTASSDTWEPERNLNCPEILDAWKADKEKEKAE
uniref:Chromobox 3 n=1 Tax=Lygus hesperus TaxID=30085 RepID=A0A0A9YW54_LYGHE